MGVVFGTTVLAGIFGRILYKWRASRNGGAGTPEATPAGDAAKGKDAVLPEDAAPARAADQRPREELPGQNAGRDQSVKNRAHGPD